MGNIKATDMLLIEEVFEMGGGYVLNFTDRTMRAFFAEELNLDIDDQKYARDGTSKGKRLRCFLQTVDRATALRTLQALWNFRQSLRANVKSAETVTNAEGRMLDLFNRLQEDNTPTQPVPAPAFNRTKIAALRTELVALWQLPPQQRGFAFEKFLKDAFDLYGLAARGAFRLQGEQIDGSFHLASQTYLLEAKWQAAPTGAADLHVFEGKLGEKASWSRGLFVSYTGFTFDGLEAFGRGKRQICMSGEDFDEMLQRELPLDRVLERKVRRAAETGRPFCQVRELF